MYEKHIMETDFQKKWQVLWKLHGFFGWSQTNGQLRCGFVYHYAIPSDRLNIAWVSFWYTVRRSICSMISMIWIQKYLLFICFSCEKLHKYGKNRTKKFLEFRFLGSKNKVRWYPFYGYITVKYNFITLNVLFFHDLPSKSKYLWNFPRFVGNFLIFAAFWLVK